MQPIPDQSADGANAPIPPQWYRRRDEKERRLTVAQRIAQGKIIPINDIVAALEALFVLGNHVVLKDNNQKQMDLLSRSLARVNPECLYDLHMIMPSVSHIEHLDIFEVGITHKLDFSFAGPQGLRISQLLVDRLSEVGAIRTYIELYVWLVVDLVSNISLVVSLEANRDGNIYTGSSTEDMPTLVEPTALSDGIAIVRVNEIVNDAADLPRVDVPGSWVDFIMQVDKPFYIESLFTRDPHLIEPVHVLMAMMAIRGIYRRHNVQSLSHGIGFNAAAIELTLPTYGERLGLKSKICRNWALNLHSTLIPAIGSGQVESVHCFGMELGMRRYVTARPDVFFTDRDGSLRSSRILCQLAGQYTMDLFTGATLQVDDDGYSSTVARRHLAGFGGTPNMGHDLRGRHHVTPAWLDMTEPVAMLEHGKKLAVQVVETFQEGGKPAFVDTLSAVAMARQSGMPFVSIMIYSDNVTHPLTEDSIVYLYKARSLGEQCTMIAAVADVTSVSLRHGPFKTEQIRHGDLIALSEDLNIRRSDVGRELLATKSTADLVERSGGLYDPPAHFRSWQWRRHRNGPCRPARRHTRSDRLRWLSLS